ncbi:MAG: deoxyribodipyrimidine photo-lyase [Geminicoccaceae bacterium]|nr:MAG: deoxyribodipyrimidine photo-lyase [Geminicoccaceae bacterium]
MPTTLVWFRQDLRLADNPALVEATKRGAVQPVYIHDQSSPGPWRPGGASGWWLDRSLERLDLALRERGSALWVGAGDPLDVLMAMAAAAEADAVTWNRCYEPFAIERDQGIKEALKARGFEVWSSNGALLFEPWTVATKGGDPYQVYTPFARACFEKSAPLRPLTVPDRLLPPKVDSTAFCRISNHDASTADWTAGLQAAWSPGEVFAINRLERFLEDNLEDYGDKRNRPDLAATSRLSPHLHWGELSPRQAWHAVFDTLGRDRALSPGSGSETFLKELLWREFGYHILYHFPHLPQAPLKPAFAGFPWADDKDARNAWRFARTGYPIVDAGMRELRTTGWMHNRVRMITGSFLVKHLLEDWQHGAAWFWDNLVDADLASNTLGWQWVAGCGPDAAPYFRVFNPVLQGEKFDPEGAYVRHWVPELADLPNKVLHSPFQAPPEVLAKAGVQLGKTYPKPIVEHKRARQRALDAFAAIKGRS